MGTFDSHPGGPFLFSFPSASFIDFTDNSDDSEG